MNQIKETNEDYMKINTSYTNLLISNEEYNLSNLPREEIKKKDDLNIENLMFEYKDISPFKFFFHLLGKYEKIILIIALLATITSGCSDVVKNYLIGDALDELGDTQEIEKLIDEEFESQMDDVEKEIDKTIRRFLTYGAIIFIFDFFKFFSLVLFRIKNNV